MKTKSHLLRLAGGAQILTALLFLFGLFGYPYMVYAADPTLPELMEQAVYSEETKGDLDAAMRLYQQVIANADSGQALAAQAQFRLASCLDKKSDYAGARAAFEKLIRDYPNQRGSSLFPMGNIADNAPAAGEGARSPLNTRCEKGARPPSAVEFGSGQD